MTAVLWSLLLLAWPSPLEAAEASKEYQLKAAFLYNFAKFVEWPTNRFNDADNPIVIAVFGRNPFGADLEKIAKDRKINGRCIAIEYVQTPDAARTAHVLFVSATEDGRLAQLNRLLQGANVLSVGESEAFARAGGIIKFTPEGDKLRFEINIDTAEQAGLKISSHLQKLAKTIRKKE